MFFNLHYITAKKWKGHANITKELSEIKETEIHVIGAVSYTHLDVYKRQMYH